MLGIFGKIFRALTTLGGTSGGTPRVSSAPKVPRGTRVAAALGGTRVAAAAAAFRVSSVVALGTVVH